MYRLKTFLVSCLFLVISNLTTSVGAAPQVGWYWNPAESGRGVFVESQNGTTFIGIYYYDSDGHATWLVAGGPNNDPYNYSGQLYALSKGQTLFGAYQKPADATIAGTMSVHFTDDTHGSLTWPGGTTQIEREVFGSGDAWFVPFSGWWWNADESGSGYSLELQGNNLFVVGFMYDDSGRPTWYYTAGPMSSPTTYHGDLIEFSGGQTIGGAYHPPSGSTPIATVDITFNTPANASITFSGKSAFAQPLTKDAPTRTDQLTREFTDASDVFATTFYSGTFHQTVTATGINYPLGFGATVTGAIQDTVRGDGLLWVLRRIDPGQASNQLVASYFLLGARITATSESDIAVPIPGVGTPTCHLTVQGTTDLRFPFTSSSTLQIDNSNHYYLTLQFDRSDLNTAGTLNCASLGLSTVSPITLPSIPIALQGEQGVIGVGNRVRQVLPVQNAPYLNTSAALAVDYDFIGLWDCDDDLELFCPNAVALHAPRVKARTTPVSVTHGTTMRASARARARSAADHKLVPERTAGGDM